MLTNAPLVFFSVLVSRAWMCAQVAKSCLSLFGPVDCSPAGFFVYGIYQARILEWVAISFSRGSSQPRDWTHISCTAGGFFTNEPCRKPMARIDISKWSWSFFFSHGAYIQTSKSSNLPTSRTHYKWVSFGIWDRSFFVLFCFR